MLFKHNIDNFFFYKNKRSRWIPTSSYQNFHYYCIIIVKLNDNYVNNKLRIMEIYLKQFF